MIETDEEYNKRFKDAGRALIDCINDKHRRGTDEHKELRRNYEAIKNIKKNKVKDIN